MRNCFCFLCLKQSLFCLHFKGYFYLVLNTKWTDHPHLPLSSTLKISVFPGGSDGKKSAYNVGDPSWIPGSGRSPGEGNGNPLQYSCQENSMDRGVWWATVHGIAESDTTKWQRVRHDWVAHTQLSSGLHYFQWYVLPFYFCPSMTFSLYFEHFLFITGFYLIMICLVVLLFTFLLAFVNLPEFVRLWFSSQLESL